MVEDLFAKAFCPLAASNWFLHMTPNQKQLDQSHRLHEFANTLRGKFLGATTWIEPLLADILAGYFCCDTRRRSLFFTEIAQRMPFERKTRLLFTILEQEFPPLVAAHPNLKAQLEELREFRNLLAHAHIDTSETALAEDRRDEVTFVSYSKGSSKVERVTCESADRRGTASNQIRDDLVRIQLTITKRPDDGTREPA